MQTVCRAQPAFETEDRTQQIRWRPIPVGRIKAEWQQTEPKAVEVDQ